MDAYRDKQIVVVGAGRSGRSLAEYFLSRGARVTLSDSRPLDQFREADQLQKKGLRLDFGGHTEELFVAADLIAISPGVPLELPSLAAAQRRSVPVLGEIEIASRELSAPLVGITGTNGKSTTTTLIGGILQDWGRKTFVGGNLGTPLIEAVDESGWDWLVVEISSFQLEAIERFRPRYGLLLNLTEDHLDRYPDMDAYMAAKKQLFRNMQTDDVAVLNGDDPLVVQLTSDLHCRKVYFSSSTVPAEGMGLEGGEIVWKMGGEEIRFPVSQLRLKGLHNLENVMAALIPPLLEGCPAEEAWRSVCAFSGLDHRMVLVRELNGVCWYNDSKGTNVGSVVKSLAGLNPPVTLIAGGKDKGGDYSPLIEMIREKVCRLILIGEAADRIEGALGGLTETLRAATLEEAVRLAHRLTPSGGSVLLSPGCSSFDMFRSYVERGEVFVRAVMELPAKEEG
ncbi:MAG: UDP-N-acetylmuramoyl-L-alanine--D-glutamate ligase [Syntrophotaleaceae bacterium]